MGGPQRFSMNGAIPYAPPHRQGHAPWQASSPSPAGVNGHGLGLRPTAVARLRSADLALAIVSTLGCLTARNTARTPLPGGRRLAPDSAGSRRFGMPVTPRHSRWLRSARWTLCLTLSDRSASWPRRRPRGYVYARAGTSCGCTYLEPSGYGLSCLCRVHRAYREAVSRQRSRHVRRHEMPKRSDPFTGAAGPVSR
jgi:hypothetical protein